MLVVYTYTHILEEKFEASSSYHLVRRHDSDDSQVLSCFFFFVNSKNARAFGKPDDSGDNDKTIATTTDLFAIQTLQNPWTKQKGLIFKKYNCKNYISYYY